VATRTTDKREIIQPYCSPRDAPVKVQAGHGVAVNAVHGVAENAVHGVAVNAGHGVAVNAGHDVAVNAGHDVAVNAGHDVAVNAGHGVAVNAGHGVAVNAGMPAHTDSEAATHVGDSGKRGCKSINGQVRDLTETEIGRGRHKQSLEIDGGGDMTSGIASGVGVGDSIDMVSSRHVAHESPWHPPVHPVPAPSPAVLDCAAMDRAVATYRDWELVGQIAAAPALTAFLRSLVCLHWEAQALVW